MKNFMRSILEKSPLKPSGRLTSPIECDVPLHYSYSSFRWHLDNRSAIKLLTVHDLFGSADFWQKALHKTITTLPLSGLTLKDPLEIFSVDLRGHAFSEKFLESSKLAKCPSSEEKEEEEINYALYSAGDLIRLQREVMVDEGRLIGVGMGAMISALAALHSPSSFHSLILLVEDFSQLFQVNPMAYNVREILLKAPQDAKTLENMDSYLKKRLPHPLDRECLLESVKIGPNSARFRFHERLLKMENPITLSMGEFEQLQYPGPVKVILYGGPDPSEEEMEAFKVNFPQSTFHSSPRADRGFFDREHVGKIVLNALDIIASMEDKQEG